MCDAGGTGIVFVADRVRMGYKFVQGVGILSGQAVMPPPGSMQQAGKSDSGETMADGKLDVKKQLKGIYAPGAVPHVCEVPELRFLTIEGQGAMEGLLFQESIEALFSVAYKVKIGHKKRSGLDVTVMPLEGLWWADDMDDFVAGRKDRWRWILMIHQPDPLPADEILAARDEVYAKKGLARAGDLRLEKLCEGCAVQMMHIGPFSEEHANIMKLHDLIVSLGGRVDGAVHKHHEIYLSDFRKVDPAKMKTVLRQPFAMP